MNITSEVIYYLFVFLIHCYADYEILIHPHLNRSRLIHFSYLTHIGFYLNFIYYTIRFFSLINVFSNDINMKGRKMLHFNFCISFIVAIAFWGMYFIDPRLLESIDLHIPICCNLTIHGLNFVFNFVEHFYMRQGNILSPFPKKYFIGFLLSYSAYALMLYEKKGIALYNLITFGWGMRIMTGVNSIILVLIADYVYLNVNKIKEKMP